MPELKVPLAENKDGIIVSPEKAMKGNNYYCPGCGDKLVFKEYTAKKNHFAHKATDTCSNETIIHKLAKKKIAQVINDYVATKNDSPIIERKCPFCKTTKKQMLPQKVTSARIEKKLESGFVVDVAVSANDKIVAGIEVRVTHAVSDEKKRNLGVPFIELDGASLIKNPMRWRPIFDNFLPLKCELCEEAKRKFEKELSIISIQSRISIPKKYYRSSYTNCPRCKKAILVFCWPSPEHRSTPPQEPMPKTIQLCTVKLTNDQYWLNACPYCKTTQSDRSLHYKVDGPFYLFRSGEDSDESYKTDMQSLATLKYIVSC